jgi:hypothetical protein
MNLVMSAPVKSAAPRVHGCRICFCSFAKAKAKYYILSLSVWTRLGKALVEFPLLRQDRAWSEEPAAEADRQCSVVLSVLFVAIWRCEGRLDGGLAVIGDVRSMVSLRVLGRGVESIEVLFEKWCSYWWIPKSSFTTSQYCLLDSCQVVYRLSFVPSHFSPHDW